MAVVYRGIDELLGRPVAVKLLRDQFAGDGEFVERFRREAQAAASLSHPNVVQIFDVGQDDGRHFIVMELVDGRNLKAVLKERGRLEPVAATAVALGVARALAHAHRHGLIHRDIKPHNILLTAEGLVKVADFGIARAASATSLTEVGTILGSVHYFSPEQARGETIGASSDLYSLGVVLYEMLCGRLPFVADSPLAVALKHLHDAPAPLRAFVPDVPEALERCVMQALAKRPADRPASADAFADQLRRAVPQAEAYSVAELVRPAEPLMQQTPRRAGSVTVAAAGQAAAPGEPSQSTRVVGRPAAGTDSPPGGNGRAPQRRPRPSPARGRRRGLVWAFALAFMVGVAASAGTLSDLLFPQEVLVPNIVGRAGTEAQALLAQRGLAYGVDRYVPSASVPAGFVVSQDPEPGRQVRQGRKVWATLSTGPELERVPDVVGLSLRDARVLITQRGFVLGTVSEGYAPDRLPNTVIFQEPAAGSELEKGRAIDLIVSRGREPLSSVTLPDFTGMELTRVAQELERLGLKMGATWPEYNSHYPPGTVIDQNPQPGIQLEQGSAVGLVYSQGPPPQAFAALSPPETPGPRPAPGQAPGDRASPQATEAPSEDAARLPESDPSRAAAPAVPGSGGLPAGPAPVGAGGSKWHSAEVSIQVPPGPAREVVVLVIDDFGPSEALRKVAPGGSLIVERVRGRGMAPRFQVYVDGRMVQEAPFPTAMGQ